MKYEKIKKGLGLIIFALLLMVIAPVVALFFLGPMTAIKEGNYFIVLKGALWVFHIVVPLLSLVSYLFFETGSELKAKYCLISLIPVFVYSWIYLPCVLSGRWDDFYGVSFGGIYIFLPISMLAIWLVSFLLSLGISTLQKLVIKRSK